MSGLERFCPACGSTAGPFVKGFCRACFNKKRNLFSVPKELKIDFCKNCAKLKIHGNWIEQESDSLKKAIESFVKPNSDFEKTAVTVELELSGNDESIAHITVNGLVDGQMVEEKKDVLIKPNYVNCDPCSRVAGFYHEAIVQLRGNLPEDAVSEARSFIEQFFSKDPLSVIVSVEKSKAGIDLLIGSRKAAKRVVDLLASKHNAEVKYSSKLVGQDKGGKKRYKFTYCVRF